jgi:LEA14-like dessication related protein
MKTVKQFYRTLIIIVALSISACASLIQPTDPPHISVVHLKLIDVQLLEQQYELTLRLQNPNESPLAIKGLSYTLETNGSKLAQGVSNQAVTIPAFSEKKLRLTMVSGTFGIIRQLQSLEQTSQSTLDYRLSGKLSLTNRLLPLYFEKTGSLDLNTMGTAQ